MAKSLIIIPTYNEHDNISQLVNEIMMLYDNLHIVIVDDDSKDGTPEVIDELSLKYRGMVYPIHRKDKKGFGSACIAGMNFGLKNGYDLILTMDADLSHQPVYIKDFLAAISENDLVIGSRYTRGISIVNWSLRRLMLSLWANMYVKAITGIKISDSTSGYRCWRRELLLKIGLDKIISEGYAFLVEMAYRAYKSKARIKEIPIIFIERETGKSKINEKILFESAIMPWKLVIKNMFGKL